MLLSNIVTGIILDTFGSLREQATERAFRMKNECFITGMERARFDEAGIDFTNHASNNPRATNHIWNYVYFMSYLDAKDEAEYNGGESYVQGMLRENSTTWIPHGTSVLFQMLKDKTEDKEVGQEHTLKNLSHEMTALEGRVDVQLQTITEKLDL